MTLQARRERQAETDRASQEIIDREARNRAEKTERLRQARLEAEKGSQVPS